MKKFRYLFASATVLALPMLVAAQGLAQPGGTGGPMKDFFNNVATFINDVAVPLIMALAFLAFVWGMFLYFIAGGANEEKREQGKSLMIYAVLGFVMIVILYGLINFLADTFGLRGQTIDVPTVPVNRVP